MYLTNTELKSFFKVISQRKRIGRGGERRGGSKRRDGFNEQFRVSMTLLLCPPSLCEEGEGGVKGSSVERRPRPASCCNAPALRAPPRGKVTAAPPLKRPSLCLLSAPREQASHSLLEEDTAVYRASQHWLSPMLRVLVTMRSLLLISNSPPVKKFIFSKQTERTEEGGECRHNVGSPLSKPALVKTPT